MTALSRAYASLFALSDHVLVNTLYGRLRLPMRGYSAGARILAFMLDMVEPQVMGLFREAVKRERRVR